MTTMNNEDPADPSVHECENAEERYCYQMLSELRKSYELAAKPYIDRLIAIKSTQTRSITLTLDQAREFVDFTMSARERQARFNRSDEK